MLRTISNRFLHSKIQATKAFGIAQQRYRFCAFAIVATTAASHTDAL
jgi:hypothetical protein